MIQEKKASALSGYLMSAVLLVLCVVVTYMMIATVRSGGSGWAVAAWVAALVVALLGWFGLSIVNPNEGKVLVLFGTYVGTLKSQGFWWVNPFTSRRAVSLRIRNFESAKLKVNDLDGNPIEIAAVVVWRVVETAEAIFQVDNYENFVHVQSEAALRNLASTYPYDAHVEGQHALRSHILEIADKLKHEIQERLSKAGVEVIEARISHLAYAPEIASAMLQRQQASAVVAARTKIVEGAVGMVEMALEELSKKQVIHLDEERKAAMVSNLLVVLCSDRHTQPVVNTGTLYQ
uniref:SPFH domain-containing protein n=1 Tax=Eiseniibacteriota bacterium TaxID=2212470 RepID=A0A832I0C9_UNCEI